MGQRTPRYLYIVLGFYIGISLLYQACSAVSLIVGYWDLRHQVQSPFSVSRNPLAITELSEQARAAGLRTGDIAESVDGDPLPGMARFQSARWHARPGESMRVGVRRSDGSRAVIAVPLIPYPSRRISLQETIFIISLHIVFPVVSLLAGFWVALARPRDPKAWLILVLLSYPSVFANVSTFNWWPGPWLVLRLYWHLWIQVAAIGALFLFGLLFPERSRLDRRAPWLKWAVLSVFVVAIGLESVFEYADWYDNSFVPGSAAMEARVDKFLNWFLVFCSVFYWVVLLDQLRTASSPDARRRLRVLCAGSIAGLGSALFIWGLLPFFGIDPATNQALGYVSVILLLAFPFSLAYVVIVQRAMDVTILIRMGTRYVLARTTLLVIQFGILALLLFQFVLPVVQRHQEYGLSVLLPIFIVAVVLRMNFMRRSPMDRAREWLDRKFFREQYDAEQVLGELADRVRRVPDPAAMIDLISTRISEVMHIPQMAVMLRYGNAFALQSGGAIALSDASPPVRHLVRTSSPAVLYHDRPADWFVNADATERHALEELKAEVLIPLPGRDRLMGVMVLGPKRSEAPYSPADLRLLQWVAIQAGMGLEVNELAHSLAEEASRHQRIQREVEIAREVQERLFPQEIPVIAGIELAGHCRPALAVGGDYYDMIAFEDGGLALAIGDVSGKGIAAALLMASLRASLRGMTADGAHDLARMMRRLNGLVYESSAVNRYATFFFAHYDPATRKLRYVNGGHNPPFIIRADEVLRLDAGGPVVGLLRDVTFEEQSVQLRPGDVFLGYTDGISEAMTLDDEEWGEERLLAATPIHSDPADILRCVFEGADRFTAGAPQHDDMTVLVMKLT